MKRKMIKKAFMIDEFKQACEGATKKEIAEDILAAITAFVFIYVLVVLL